MTILANDLRKHWLQRKQLGARFRKDHPEMVCSGLPVLV